MFGCTAGLRCSSFGGTILRRLGVLWIGLSPEWRGIFFANLNHFMLGALLRILLVLAWLLLCPLHRKYSYPCAQLYYFDSSHESDL